MAAPGRTSSYNPTLGQSVIPTHQAAYYAALPGSLQSHARAIRHSDPHGLIGRQLLWRRYNPTLGQSVIPTTKRSIAPPRLPICYNPTLGQSVTPTTIGGSVKTSLSMLQSHARAIRHSDKFLPLRAACLVRLQSHARAIRHSDTRGTNNLLDFDVVTIQRSGNPSFRLVHDGQRRHLRASYNPTLGQSVIPTNVVAAQSQACLRRYNPTLGQSVIPTTKTRPPRARETACYNPTLGQSVIPTLLHMFKIVHDKSYNPTLGQSVIPTRMLSQQGLRGGFVTIPRSGNPSFRRRALDGVLCCSQLLQSHARAIRHSDELDRPPEKIGNGSYNPTLGQSVIPTYPPLCPRGLRQCIVTIPRSGNPSFRLRIEVLLWKIIRGYNPTLGQSVIPTNSSWRASVTGTVVTIPRSGNPSFRQVAGESSQSQREFVTIPRSGNPSFRRSAAS